MAKGKGRKRKLAQTTSSEESSSQSQGPKELPEESRPPARYAPKFGNPSKKAKLVLRKTQDDSCTQPEKVVMEGFTDTLVSATQPVPKQYASQMLLEEHSNYSDSSCGDQRAAKESFTDKLVSNTQPVPIEDPPQVQTVCEDHSSSADSVQGSNSIIPGLSLTQANTPQMHAPHINDNDERSQPFPHSSKEEGLECASPKENMNLELLNPFSDDEESIGTENTNTESTVDSILAPAELQRLYTTNEQPHTTASEALLISQLNDDATLPNSQDLPEDSANIVTLYDDPQDANKAKVDTEKGLREMDADKCLSGEEGVCAGVGDKVVKCVGGEEGVCGVVEDKVMEEMMGLRAEDLLESQLNTDLAIVPSVSPAKMGPKEAPQAHKHAGYSFNQLGGTSTHTEGQGVLRGLIQELSSINQYILHCKRELEAARKQRDTWLRTRHPPRHR